MTVSLIRASRSSLLLILRNSKLQTILFSLFYELSRCCSWLDQPSLVVRFWIVYMLFSLHVCTVCMYACTYTACIYMYICLCMNSTCICMYIHLNVCVYAFMFVLHAHLFYSWCFVVGLAVLIFFHLLIYVSVEMYES